MNKSTLTLSSTKTGTETIIQADSALRTDSMVHQAYLDARKEASDDVIMQAFVIYFYFRQIPMDAIINGPIMDYVLNSKTTITVQSHVLTSDMLPKVHRESCPSTRADKWHDRSLLDYVSTSIYESEIPLLKSLLLHLLRMLYKERGIEVVLKLTDYSPFSFTGKYGNFSVSICNSNRRIALQYVCYHEDKQEYTWSGIDDPSSGMLGIKDVSTRIPYTKKNFVITNEGRDKKIHSMIFELDVKKSSGGPQEKNKANDFTDANMTTNENDNNNKGSNVNAKDNAIVEKKEHVSVSEEIQEKKTAEDPEKKEESVLTTEIHQSDTVQEEKTNQ